MARRCIAFACQQSTGLHNFPVDLEVRQQWLSAIGIESSELRPGDGICNEHFTRDSFSNLIEVEMGFLKRLRLKSQAVPTLALTKRRNQQFRRLEPKVTQEIGCPTEPVTCKSKATQAKASNRSVSCDTGTLTEHSFPESPRACSTSLKRKRWELSTNDLSNQMAGSPSTVNSTSTCEVSQHKGKEYIVNEDQLLKLFQRCPVCGQTCTIQKSTVGTLLRVNQLCRHCDFHDEWSSQPLVNSIPVGNIQLRAAVLFTSFCQKAKERNSSLNQAEPEPPQIKEELCSNQEGRQLVLNQQTDVKEEVKSECEKTLKVCGNIMSDFKEELDQDCGLQNTIRIPETPLLREGAQTELQPINQKNSSLDQAEPELPQIKEEPEELCSHQEQNQLVLNQEAKVKVEFKSCVLDHQHHLGEIIRIPVIKLQIKDLSKKHIPKEENDEQPIWKQERSPSLDEKKPEIPQIKEEWEEVCIRNDEEQLELKQETDAFMVTEHDQEKMDSKPEPNEYPPLESNTQIRNSDSVTVQLDTLSHDSSHSCDTCGKVYTRRANLKTHMRIHTGEKPYSCKVCKKGCTTSSALKDHMRTHTGERPFTCKVCRKSFTQGSVLKAHIRIHTGEKPFICEVCQKRFSASSNLLVHMKTHTGEKPYTCKVCEKCFINKTKLKVHTRIHTGEKPFTCKICEKNFSQNCQLKVHMRTHTGERPFTCKMCEKNFAHSSQLKVHMRSHTGERPFTCKICDKKFACSSPLKVHMRTHKS